MMLLACILPLLAVATAWPNTLNGYPSWPNRPTFASRTEVAQLFRHLGDENLAVAIANEFESLNINMTAPFHKVQLEVALRAVQKIVAYTVPTAVPEGCSETVALQAFLGFGRHYFHELFERSMMNAVKESNEVVRIALIADSAVTSPSTLGGLSSSGMGPHDLETVPEIQNVLGGIRSYYPKMAGSSFESQRWEHIRYLAKEMSQKLSLPGLKTDVLSRIGIRAPSSGVISVNDIDIPTWENIEEIKNAVISELDRKLERIAPKADFMVMDKFFKAIKNLIVVEGAKGKSVGEVLQKLSMLCQTELSTVYSGMTCDSTLTIPTKQAGIQDVISYMKGGYLTVVESYTRSPLMKNIIMQKLTVPMSKFADALIVIQNVYTPSNIPEFMVSLLGEAKQHIVTLHTVSQLVREFVNDQTLYPFVSSLVEQPQGQGKPLLKILLRTFAMQLAKLNVDPQEIRICLESTIRALTSTTSTTGPISSSLYYQLY